MKSLVFFAALRNQRIHKTLEYIHDKPQDQWSLELLGEQVGMSRATLARQFKKSCRHSPMTISSQLANDESPLLA